MIYSNEQKNNLRIKIDYNNMMKKYIGEYGIADAELWQEKPQRRIRPWKRSAGTDEWTGEIFRIIRKKLRKT